MGIQLHDAGAGGTSRSRFFPAAACRLCDCCKSAAAVLFCRPDSAFMCLACDAKAHSAGGGKHGRVWMCEVCEQSPAAVTCKADAAALCVTCDRDIHSANPLASRHERSAVVPFYDTAESVVIKSTAAAATVLLLHSPDAKLDAAIDDHTAGGDWTNPIGPIVDQSKIPADNFKVMELLLQDSDQFLDFDNYQISSQPYSDSVVPVQSNPKPPVPPGPVSENRFEIDFARSTINSYNNSSFAAAPSLSHSVSSSSMEVGVVPDGGSLSEISYPFSRNINYGSGDPTGNHQGSSQVVRMDREARVLRYKEKRKNRKFEKTIRYASRKAYAETRPRIKGRFAKRTDAESDMDRIFSANFVSDARYGVVPSF
ncbi:zinc finger protein CONSTANS-LIKE 5-like [Andrographis paniculata]|uniref:zinc finger protein CONSTANS-LIKE 5-like n=1 Tax=Andrographis paniculata TaxID=175694 RepID=UPI0021E9140B|nr:zinc finger protein CONSTANS-LIKE 5-like [Andrographis paniculata]